MNSSFVFNKLRQDRFSGSIIVRFNQGGIRNIKKLNEEDLKLDDSQTDSQ